jgi:putative ABC transport system permease protein
MSWIGRFTNLLRRGRLDRELEEELASHIEQAIEQGRSPEEARRAFGSTLRHRETSRDIKLLPWLDALSSDIVFAWRQLHKHRTASAAAILSLALAIGATTAAFRLVDAVLLRPLPVSDPHRLYDLAVAFVDREGRPDYRDDQDYPTFRKFRRAVEGKAALILASGGYQEDLTIGASGEIERPFREYVSGNFFPELGLQPALGRLLTPNDDVAPGGHPVAVIGYDYWTRRFGRDTNVIGKTFRFAGTVYQIVGVAARGFTSVEPGVMTDLYIPASMRGDALNSPGWSWFRILVRPKPGVPLEQIRQPLQAALMNDLQGRVQSWSPDTPKQAVVNFLHQSVLLLPASAGASNLQKQFRQPLTILVVLVVLVLLVACANVGNLLSAQAVARAREMALRVSIGAGRTRLVQMLLVESMLLAASASTLGALFSWWSAPLVVSMLASAEQPVRLALDADWRAVGFGVGLTVVVSLLFGLMPALRSSAVEPVHVLRGAQEPHARRGVMKLLVAAQVAFSVLVLFVAGLFVTTLNRLTNHPLGFSPDHLLYVHVERPASKEPADIWRQVSGRIPGVQSVALAGWTVMSGNHWTVNVETPGHTEEKPSYCLDVSPGFFETMRIAMIDGREFRAGDIAPANTGRGDPAAGVGIVNEALARVYFDGQNPVGRTVRLHMGKEAAPMTIVGYVRDAVYSDVRETVQPTVYVPVGVRNGGALLLRTAGEPLALATGVRREIPRIATGFSVRNVESQMALVRRQMVRERLLSTLSLFFATLALLLSGVGLYGVLNYSVTQQRKEIGIRMALGAQSIQIVQKITMSMLGLVLLGAAVGVMAGFFTGRFTQTLLFEVKVTDAQVVVTPVLLLLSAGLLAALPPAIRATRIDPAETLRGE